MFQVEHFVMTELYVHYNLYFDKTPLWVRELPGQRAPPFNNEGRAPRAAHAPELCATVQARMNSFLVDTPRPPNYSPASCIFSRGNHRDLEEPMAASRYWYPWSQCSLSGCPCPRSNLYRLGHPRPHLESQQQSSLTDRPSARSLVAKTLNRIQLRCLSGGIVSKKNSDAGGKQTANGEHLWCQLGWKREELFDDG